MQNPKLITSRLVKAGDIGMSSNLFGGNMMAYIDEAAAIMAYEVCMSSRMVTRKVSNIEFRKPVKTDSIIKFYGTVKNVGRTSITLFIEVKKLYPDTGVETTVTDCELVFVRTNQDGDSTPIDKHIVEDLKEELGL